MRMRIFIAFIIITIVLLYGLPSYSSLEKNLPDLPQKEFKPLEKLPLTVFSLIVVCFLVVIILKFLGTKGILHGSFNQSNIIKILERHALGPKQMLLLVEVAGKYFLIGLTDRGFMTLSEFNKKELNLNEENKKNNKNKNYLKEFLKTRIPFIKGGNK